MFEEAARARFPNSAWRSSLLLILQLTNQYAKNLITAAHNGKNYKDEKLHVFKATVGFFVAADWLKQETCIIGLIFAPSIRPRFINHSENNNF